MQIVCNFTEFFNTEKKSSGKFLHSIESAMKRAEPEKLEWTFKN